jgi:hypothetical protein
MAPTLGSGRVNHTTFEDIPEGEVLRVLSYYLDILSSSYLTLELRMTS